MKHKLIGTLLFLTVVLFGCNRPSEKHKIEVRSGLHCSAIAHKTLGTYPHGSVRFSLSNYHSDNDLLHLYDCIADINGSI